MYTKQISPVQSIKIITYIRSIQGKKSTDFLDKNLFVAVVQNIHAKMLQFLLQLLLHFLRNLYVVMVTYKLESFTRIFTQRQGLIVKSSCYTSNDSDEYLPVFTIKNNALL